MYEFSMTPHQVPEVNTKELSKNNLVILHKNHFIIFLRNGIIFAKP